MNHILCLQGACVLYVRRKVKDIVWHLESMNIKEIWMMKQS